MKKFLRIFIIGIMGICISSLPKIILAADKTTTGNVNILFGRKSLDDNDWAPLEEQDEVGFEFDIRAMDWPVSLVFGYLKSDADDTLLGVNISGETTELSFGVKKIWEEDPTIRPFVGGGLAQIKAEVQASLLGVSVSDSDSSVGFWVNGGVYLTINQLINIGLVLRISGAQVNLFGENGAAGGTHYGIFAGFHF